MHYDTLIDDPLGTVRQLYRHFGSEVSGLHARRMEAFLEHRPMDAFGRHRYDPAYFGWTYTGLAEEFGDYIERYHIRSEIRVDQPRGHIRSEVVGADLGSDEG